MKPTALTAQEKRNKKRREANAAAGKKGRVRNQGGTDQVAMLIRKIRAAQEETGYSIPGATVQRIVRAIAEDIRGPDGDKMRWGSSAMEVIRCAMEDRVVCLMAQMVEVAVTCKRQTIMKKDFHCVQRVLGREYEYNGGWTGNVYQFQGDEYTKEYFDKRYRSGAAYQIRKERAAARAEQANRRGRPDRPLPEEHEEEEVSEDSVAGGDVEDSDASGSDAEFEAGDSESDEELQVDPEPGRARRPRSTRNPRAPPQSDPAPGDAPGPTGDNRAPEDSTATGGGSVTGGGVPEVTRAAAV